jgi:hypothetical protein
VDRAPASQHKGLNSNSSTTKRRKKKKGIIQTGVVDHVCDPSSSGGEMENGKARPTQTKVRSNPIFTTNWAW